MIVTNEVTKKSAQHQSRKINIPTYNKYIKTVLKEH